MAFSRLTLSNDESVLTDISVGSIANWRIQGATCIRSLTASEWLDSDDQVDLSAQDIGTIRITGSTSQDRPLRGDFQADVRLESTGALDTVDVAGWIDHSQIVSTSGINSISAGGFNDSIIRVNSWGEDVPTPGVEDLYSARGWIYSVVVRGITGEPYSLVNTIFAARYFGSVTLRDAQWTTPDGKPWGFVCSPNEGVCGLSYSDSTGTYGEDAFLTQIYNVGKAGDFRLP